MEFYKEYFSRLPGYPTENNNGGLDMAVYCLIPGDGLLVGGDLLSAMEEATAAIEAALGM